MEHQQRQEGALFWAFQLERTPLHKHLELAEGPEFDVLHWCRFTTVNPDLQPRC